MCGQQGHCGLSAHSPLLGRAGQLQARQLSLVPWPPWPSALGTSVEHGTLLPPAGSPRAPLCSLGAGLVGTGNGPGAWSLSALWPVQPGPLVPPCLSPRATGGLGSPHGCAGAKGSGESPSVRSPARAGSFAGVLRSLSQRGPLAGPPSGRGTSRQGLAQPAWSPAARWQAPAASPLSLSTGRSQHTPRSTAGSAARTRWCPTGTATAGTARTVSSTTASRRCGHTPAWSPPGPPLTTLRPSSEDEEAGPGSQGALSDGPYPELSGSPAPLCSRWRVGRLSRPCGLGPRRSAC